VSDKKREDEDKMKQMPVDDALAMKQADVGIAGSGAVDAARAAAHIDNSIYWV
jgi:hypothetical protein